MKWRLRVPLLSSSGCLGLSRFDLAGFGGHHFLLLLDATINFQALAKQPERDILHPVDAYFRFAPVSHWWIERSHHRDSDERSASSPHLIAMRLSRHCSKKTLSNAVLRVVDEAAHAHAGRQRWLAGVGTSPVAEVRLEGCWILLKVRPGYRPNSLRRAFDHAVFQLGPGAIEMPGRHLHESHLLLGLWAFYRRLSEPGARSKDMILDLQDRLGLRGVDDLSLNTDLFRFRRAFITSLSAACETLRKRQVDFYLDPASHRIVRNARLTRD